eukprot:SAG31_NODE_9538_length_1261_cov_1.607573_2_plen_44_part_00
MYIWIAYAILVPLIVVLSLGGRDGGWGFLDQGLKGDDGDDRRS